MREALPVLVKMERQRCAPADDEEMLAALAKTLVVCGGGLNHAERVEWQVVLLDELQTIPADLAMEALAKARRTCRHASQILAAITEYVEDLPHRRRQRVQSLTRLAQAYGVQI